MLTMIAVLQLAKELQRKICMIHYLLLKNLCLFLDPFIAILMAMICRLKYDVWILQFPRFRLALGTSTQWIGQKKRWWLDYTSWRFISSLSNYLSSRDLLMRSLKYFIRAIFIGDLFSLTIPSPPGARVRVSLRWGFDNSVLVWYSFIINR